MVHKLTATGLAGLAMALVLVTSVVAPGLAFAATGPSDDGPSGNETDAPTETPTNETDDGNETGMPAGVEAFTATTPLSGDQTEPPSLAGKLRVESPYSENTTVELLRNSSTNFTLAINVTGGAENVTFYLQETAFAASQNVTNVNATLDGEPLALGRTEASGSPWIGFEIDEFSTRIVTFETDVENGTDPPEAAPPPVVGDAAPRDGDGDGTYEDIDGDGELTVFDVQAFLDSYRSDAVQNNAGKFDFDGRDDGVDVFDVQALLEEL